MYKNNFGNRSRFRNSRSNSSASSNNSNRFSSRRQGGFGRRPSISRRKDLGMNPMMFVRPAVIKKAEEAFTPIHKFCDFNIDNEIKIAIEKKGYINPTPIQDQAIEPVLNGSDVVGIANTGTGKTAAFLIPLMHKVRRGGRQKVLVIVPTHELAMQIENEFKSFAGKLNLYSACCVGGASIGRQISWLRQGRASFIIGTPGRLKDLAMRGFIKMADFNNVVLDEADRLLDMGFIGDVRAMLSCTPKDRQTLFFSATMSAEIEGLINEFLKKDFVKISVKTSETSQNIDQDIIRVQRGTTKFDILHNLLVKDEFKKVLVFGRTKHGVEKLSKSLVQKGIRAESIHGNKKHNYRLKAITLFKQNAIQVLVATDVAARGLDISDITHVVNFDLPATYQDYVHRIGRTGRGDKMGKALTLID